MCATCMDVIRQYWPDIKPDENLGFAGQSETALVLWDATAFPVCGPDILDAQIAEYRYLAALGLSKCGQCGRPMGMPDGKIHIGALCSECRGTEVVGGD